VVERAVRFAPADSWARLHYGLGLQATGRHSEAAPLFRACLTLLPDDPAPALNWATSLLALGDIQGAIHNVRCARLRAPNMSHTHYTLALAYLSSGFNERADPPTGLKRP